MKQWCIGVKIVLSILIFSSSTNIFARVTTRNYKSSEIIHKAEIICTATVVSTQCQWMKDSRGRHIYTNVELFIGQTIKGNLASNHVNLEVVGGTVGDITESVSNSPVFQTGEQTMLFLEGEPLHLVGGIMGKRPIFDDHVFWDGRKVSLEALSTSLASGKAEVFAESDEIVFADDEHKEPIITSITPDIGSAGTGNQVTISGIGFGKDPNSGTVKFFYGREDEPPTIEASILSWSDTEIVCMVPIATSGYPGSAGSGPVTVTTWSGTSNGYPFRVTFGYEDCRWPGENPAVSYYINENTPDCNDEGAAVEAAAETWNGTGASIQIYCAGSHENNKTDKNGVNEIMWGTRRNGVLGTTYNDWRQTVYDNNGFPVGERFLEVDIVLNLDNKWTTDPCSPYTDVQSIALHEFGHFLGLRDLYGNVRDGEYDVGKVMYGIGEALMRDLHPDDVAGIHWIYNPTSPPTISGSIGYPSSDDDGVYIVNWTPCSEASSYQLERSTDGVNWVQVYTGPHTYFEDIVDIGNYRYRVAASNIAGSSAWQTGDWDCIVHLLWEGSGEPNDPFLISTAGQLDRVGTHSRWWSRHFQLIADIDLSGYGGQNGRPAFHVIAPNAKSEYWTGVFDGNDHIISNFTCISSDPGHAGLFGYIADPNAEVKRLRLVNSYIERIEAEIEDRVGSLVGILEKGTITSCYIYNTS
ncbi:IPT/TIG domain-containing protein, partial [Planctomycetota bacterium]